MARDKSAGRADELRQPAPPDASPSTLLTAVSVTRCFRAPRSRSAGTAGSRQIGLPARASARPSSLARCHLHRLRPSVGELLRPPARPSATPRPGGPPTNCAAPTPRWSSCCAARWPTRGGCLGIRDRCAPRAAACQQPGRSHPIGAGRRLDQLTPPRHGQSRHPRPSPPTPELAIMRGQGCLDSNHRYRPYRRLRARLSRAFRVVGRLADPVTAAQARSARPHFKHRRSCRKRTHFTAMSVWDRSRHAATLGPICTPAPARSVRRAATPTRCPSIQQSDCYDPPS